jgi:preprotein translocase subunit SecE
MNRAVRRQRLKEPKERAAARAIPRATGPGGPPSRGSAGRSRLGLPRFAAEIISELRKVVWPTRDDVVYLTIVVVVVTLILGAVLGAIDIGFGWFIEKTLLT